MSNPTIEIGQTVVFIPGETEANTFARHMYQTKRLSIRGLLSGTVIEKGLRWKTVNLDNEIKLVRIELLLVKDNADGNLWSVQADRVLNPEFQTSNEV